MGFRLKVPFCRMCRGTENLVSLFDGDENRLESFKQFYGIDLSEDKNKLAALACDGCIRKLDDLAVTRRKIQDIDEFYVQPLRDLIESDTESYDALQMTKEVPRASTFSINFAFQQQEVVQQKVDQDIEEENRKIEAFESRFIVVKPEEFEQSLSVTENGKIDSSARLKTQKPGLHSCHICNKIFCLKSSVSRHIKAVHLEQRHQCPSCTQSFSQRDNLLLHKKILHDQNGAACSQCEKVYKSWSGLVTHIESVHKQKRYPCAFCDKIFVRRRNLSSHLIGVHKCSL